MTASEIPPKPSEGVSFEHVIQDEDVRIFIDWIAIQKGGSGPAGTYLKNLAKLSLANGQEAYDRQAIYGDEPNPRKNEKSLSREMKEANEAATRFLGEGYNSYLQHARERGSNRALKLENIEGGGRNNPSKSLLRSIPIEEAFAQVNTRSEHHLTYKRFGPEDVKLSLLGMLIYPTGRIQRRSWTRWYYQSRYVAVVVLICFYVMFALMATNLGKTAFTGTHAALLITALIMTSMFYLYTLRPLLKINRYNLLSLDEIYLSWDEAPALLERKKDPDNIDWNMTEVCRYSALCGVCGSDVAVQDGGQEWPGRIVGTCLQNPSEHAYSFDRFNLRGYPLRPSMVGKPEWSS